VRKLLGKIQYKGDVRPMSELVIMWMFTG